MAGDLIGSTVVPRGRGLPDLRGSVVDYVNSVHLVGRVTAVGEPRTLPSGDTVHTLRLVVPRPERRGTQRAGVDTIDVACWAAGVRRGAARLTVDDHVEVQGALRRRFFRAGGVVASRYEVEAQRLSRCAAPMASADGRTG